MMGSSTKVSIHGGGQAQWSMNADWYGNNRPGQPNRNRHIIKWNWPAPTGTEATHVFRISVAGSELRRIVVAEDLSHVHWLPAPGEGEKATVECYMSPVGTELAPRERADFLVALELSSGRSFVALVSKHLVTASDRRNLALVRAEAQEQARLAAEVIGPGYRGVGVFCDDSGVRGMFEFVPSAV